jgi:transcription initiation factor TFIIIB Brf1 subunit/transcription initiation factor TFIIB
MSKLSVLQLKNTPSRQYISQELEFIIRRECCLLIKKAGILLNLKVQTSNTAQILLQKFYYVQKITKNKIISVIIGSLFISTKVEEDPKSLKEIIKAVDFLHKGVKDGIEGIELEILINVGFKVSVVQPHSFLLNILNSLGKDKSFTI